MLRTRCCTLLLASDIDQYLAWALLANACDRQTNGQTTNCYTDPTPHTMRAASTNTTLSTVASVSSKSSCWNPQFTWVPNSSELGSQLQNNHRRSGYQSHEEIGPVQKHRKHNTIIIICTVCTSISQLTLDYFKQHNDTCISEIRRWQ